MKITDKDFIDLHKALQDWESVSIAKCTNHKLIYSLEINTDPPSYIKYAKDSTAPPEKKIFDSIEECLEEVKEMTNNAFVWWTPAFAVKKYKVKLLDKPVESFHWEDHHKDVFNTLFYIHEGGFSHVAFGGVKIIHYDLEQHHFILQVAEPNNKWHRPFSRYLVRQGTMDKYRYSKDPQRLLHFEEITD